MLYGHTRVQFFKIKIQLISYKAAATPRRLFTCFDNLISWQQKFANNSSMLTITFATELELDIRFDQFLLDLTELPPVMHKTTTIGKQTKIICAWTRNLEWNFENWPIVVSFQVYDFESTILQYLYFVAWKQLFERWIFPHIHYSLIQNKKIKTLVNTNRWARMCEFVNRFALIQCIWIGERFGRDDFYLFKNCFWWSGHKFSETFLRSIK